MNTPAHLLFGAAAFGRAGQPRTTVAALTGSALPDVSLYLLVGVSIWGLGIEPRVVFGEYYYSTAWQAIFAVDNSFVLWGIGLALAIWARSAVWVAFTGAAMLHLTTDFLLHNQDARRQFWPITDWVFASPVSYWDRRHYGDIVGPAEVLASLILSGLLLYRLASPGMRVTIIVITLAELASTGVWSFVF